ncbi:MAG TPA: DedA family protein [Solirubrobacteraceae bacterium]|jgi:undecaprenyl-diphosphatase|nr:DedA family protein [Solirubrobacteraceae bacterium]
MILAFSLTHVAQNLGYPALVVLVLAESLGVPLPGETALLTAGVLASQHKLSIELVILLAAVSAIIGGNIGYLIGARGGRYLLERPGPFAEERKRVLETGEPFFATHGPKAVFISRWILGLRTFGAWLAGASHMSLPEFEVYNALGGIGWAVTIGLLAYYVGNSIKHVITSVGLWALVAAAVLAAAFLVWRRRRRRQRAGGESG